MAAKRLTLLKELIPSIERVAVLWKPDVPTAHFSLEETKAAAMRLAITLQILENPDLGNLGIVAGIWADKFDQLAAFQNFIIMPLTFLSGVFYSIHSLPPFWLALSHANPIFYLIDGFRYGFFGHADVDPRLGLAIASVSFLALSFAVLLMLQRGYKLRH